MEEERGTKRPEPPCGTAGGGDVAVEGRRDAKRRQTEASEATRRDQDGDVRMEEDLMCSKYLTKHLTN